MALNEKKITLGLLFPTTTEDCSCSKTQRLHSNSFLKENWVPFISFCTCFKFLFFFTSDFNDNYPWLNKYNNSKQIVRAITP